MHIHFIGICGTAMGNVALLMRAIGHTVTGSDENIYPPMSDLLAEAGVEIMAGFSAGNLEPRPGLVVIGNRMSRGNVEVETVLDRRLRYTSLPELLKNELIQGRTSIVLTGTHGKTTTSSLMAWVLESAGRSPNFMIGGVPGNFTAGWQYSPESDLVVLEGDEYDTAFFDKRSKFVHYLPTALLVNNIEFDHADIFNSLGEITLAFRRLVNIVPSNGVIVANGDDPNVLDVVAESLAPVETFGLGDGCAWRAVNIEYRNDSMSFDVEHNGLIEGGLQSTLLGEFNVRNLLGVVAVARWLGVSYEEIDRAFATFTNTKRRLELKGEWGGVKVYDDFAHHPTAIRETLQALRLRHPDEKLWAVFEPRSNTTRRNVFQKELVECFFPADRVVLAQIDRLDEVSPEERLDPGKLIEDLKSHGVEAIFLPDAERIVEYLRDHVQRGEVVAVMSNGDFGGIHGKLAATLGRQSETSITPIT